MKYISFFLILLTAYCHADTYPSCDLHDAREARLYSNGTEALIDVSIKGSPCYEAELTIGIYVSGNLVYLYKAPFKPHVAIHWQDLATEDAKEFIKAVYAPHNIIDCRNLLPSTAQDGDPSGYNFNSLLVEKSQYEKYMASNCKAFIHLVQYETSRAIVFPSNLKKGVPVSEFGS